MAAEKKVYVRYRLRDRGGDLTKPWYVEYKDAGRRLKAYRGINQHHTVEGRKAAAQRLIAELKGEQVKLTTSFELALRDYIARHQSQWRQKTLEQYRSCSNTFLEYLGGRECREDRALEFLAHIRATRHPTTYNRYVSYLKRLLKKTGYADLTTQFETIRATPTPARYFQKYQAKRLLNALDEREPDVGLFVRYIYYCFLRPNEIRQLRVGDLLLEDWMIRVPGVVSKNRKTQMIIVPDAFRPALLPLRERGPGEWLFPSPLDAGKPLAKNYMYRHHKAILKKLNFGTEYTLYSWKHTGAVMAAKAGVSVKELQLQLRHHSLDQTDQYLRQMGVQDLSNLQRRFPELGA